MKERRPFLRILLVLSKNQWFFILAALITDLLSMAFGVISPLFCRYIFDNAITKQGGQNVLLWGGLWLLCIICAYLADYASSRFAKIIDTKGSAKLKLLTLEAYLKKRGRDGHSKGKNGDDLSRILVDTDKFVERCGLTQISQITVAIVMITVVAIVTLYLDWPLAIMCFTASLIVVIVQQLLSGKIQTKYAEVSRVRANITSLLTDILSVWRTIIRHSQVKQEVSITENELVRLTQCEVKAHKQRLRIMLAVRVIAGIMPMCVLWYGAHRLHSGYVSIGTLIAFLTYLQMLNHCLIAGVSTILSMHEGIGQASVIFDCIFSKEPELPDCASVQQDFFKELKIDHMSIEADEFTLQVKEVTLTAGHTYLLRGDSGSGKSVFLECLAGLRSPVSAVFRLDEKVLTAEEYRVVARTFGYMFKGDLLLNRTISKNIVYGCNDQGRQEMALEWASILKIDNKLESLGSTVSAGELQRTVQIREMLRSPSVFLVDEAMDSLDQNMRVSATRLLRNYLPEAIIIICTHNQYNMDTDGTIWVANGLVDMA